MPILNRKQRVSDEIPTASMADIAFLLLVFFLTTTVFNEEKGLPIVLPEEKEEQEVSAKNLLFLIVQPDGSVVVRRGESEQEQIVAYRQVEAGTGGESEPDRGHQDGPVGGLPSHDQRAGRGQEGRRGTHLTADGRRVTIWQ